MKFEAVEDPFHPSVCRPPIDHEAESPWRVREEKIVCDGEVGNEADFLEGRSDSTGLGGSGSLPRDMDRLTEDGDRAGVGDDEPTQNLDQRRLAGAVLTKKSVNLTAGHCEANAIERLSRAKALAYVLHLQSGRGSVCGKCVHRALPADGA